jgi:hypothetical protein
MKKGWSFLAVIVAAVMILSFAEMQPALAREPKLGAPKAFKADFTYHVGNNPPEHGTMYFSHGHIREEVMPSKGGPKQVTIIDTISKTIYSVDDTQKTFKVLPWDVRASLIAQALKHFEKHKLVETKTVDGQEVEDFEIEPRDKSIKHFHLFINKETRFPVQLITEDPDPANEIHIDWTHVTPGYQPAIMFAPPLGYQQTK